MLFRGAVTSQGAKWISRFAVLSAYSLTFTKLHPGGQEDQAAASKRKFDIEKEEIEEAYTKNDQLSKGSLAPCVHALDALARHSHPQRASIP